MYLDLLLLSLIGLCQLIAGNNTIKLEGVYVPENEVWPETVYQIPEKPLKGVVFFAHGCSHSALDLWPPSIKCPKCIGLPIEMSTAESALANNYAVIAISSINRQTKCWSSQDVSRVQKVIHNFYETVLNIISPEAHKHIPLHLVGVSSGGSFVGAVAQSSNLRPPASTAYIQISSVHMMNHHDHYVPPLLFVLMPKDPFTSFRLNNTLHSAHRHITHKILHAEEKKITSNFFHQHSFGLLSEQDSIEIQKALLTEGLLHPTTLLLKSDPRQSDWRPVSILII